ncbi:MAG: tRNA threonylcarbamoyladenosine biosynthesis protein TsaE [Planctomycetota bacterium]|jgi:tRNA threonylcarbamoyladenosine biosynthesis protein TsaE
MQAESRMLARLISTSPEATEALGESLGKALWPGAVLALVGDLGAGKTCFVRGLARGLGIPPGVASPTYTLMQAHEGGRLPLYHFDAWLQGREAALFEDGGDEWLRGEGVAVVEWAQRVEEWLPRPYLQIELSHLAVEQRGVALWSVEGAQDPTGASFVKLVAGLDWPAGLEITDSGPNAVNRPDSGPLEGH